MGPTGGHIVLRGHWLPVPMLWDVPWLPRRPETCEGRALTYNEPVLQALCSNTVFKKAVLSGRVSYTKPSGTAYSAERGFMSCRKARLKTEQSSPVSSGPRKRPCPPRPAPPGDPSGSAASEVVAFSWTGLSRPQCPTWVVCIQPGANGSLRALSSAKVRGRGPNPLQMPALPSHGRGARP